MARAYLFMHHKKLVCRLQRYRLHWSFSLTALAKLLGGFNHTHFARIEAGEGVPSLKLAFACQVLFGVPLDIMFPHIYAEVEDETMRSIAAAHEGLLQTTHPLELRKRQLLELALQRAISRSTVQGV
jgi:DNA-binding XRE family transcriptional regulator